MAKPSGPVVEVPLGSPERGAADALATECRRLLGVLDKAGAFANAPKSQIRIVLGTSAMTHHARRRSPGQAMHPPPVELVGAPYIELGALLMASGEARKLRDAGATADQALAFVLAHEARHLTDMIRLRDCGGAFQHSESSYFGQAADSCLPTPVRELLLGAATTYKPFSRLPIAGHIVAPADVVKASDIAVELRADLEAKIWLDKAGMWDAGVQAAVIAMRCADENVQPPSMYQIGSEWLALAATSDLDSATTRTMERCVSILASSPGVASEIAVMAQAIDLPIKLSPPPTFIDRLLGRGRPR